MYGNIVSFYFTIVVIYITVPAQANRKSKCDLPPSAPQKIENAINECQDEIKLAILSEALEQLDISKNIHHREKRAAFTDDEKRIAGCLLQCVYRKLKAVNGNGFPTRHGLIQLYTEGIKQKDYNLATIQAVDTCLERAQKDYIISPQSLEDHGKACDIAYDTFDCISEEIGTYCGQSP